MGGVNAKKQRGLAAPDNPKLVGTQHHQPRPWIATGKGWMNRLPNFAAEAGNANASLVNRAATTGDDLYRMYLFVNAVATGYALAGEYGQGKAGRVFYPRNMSQDDLVIEGQVSNQYEYDRLVQFIAHHHMTQFTSDFAVAQSLDGDQSYPGVEFSLFRPMNGQTVDAFTPMRNLVVVTDIAAGHERFKNMPAFTLQCKVLYDYLESPLETWDKINRLITRQQVFGNAINPDPTSGASPAPRSATTMPGSQWGHI